MDSTVSVSKGVFLFKNGYKKAKAGKSRQKTIFEHFFKTEPWYAAYRRNWKSIETSLKDLHFKTYSLLLSDIVSYVKSFDNQDSNLLDGVIPSATLLTGVNQPDHVSQFSALIEKIRNEVTPHIAMVHSQDAPTIKHLVENTVWQLIHGHETLNTYNEEEDSDDDITVHKPIKKKSQCTMKVLQHWFQNRYSSNSPKKRLQPSSPKSLVVVIPDFEGFNSSVLQDFVMIVSSYVPSLPIVFVFGVATSVSALHKSFPYHVSSKLLIKVFHSHSSPVYMNQVLEDIFLTHTSPFHVSGKAFELLTDVFLFYDFSVMGLIQSIKYCMIDHYYGDNIKSLCCERSQTDEAIMNLTGEDLENIRQLRSFRPFLEAQDCQMKINLFENDGIFREVLYNEMNKLHDYLYSFYVCIRTLAAFVVDLPRNTLGKTVREIYTKCAVECVTSSPAFKESMQLLNFQSQVKLVDTIKNALKVVNAALKIASCVKPLRSTPTKNNLNNIQLNTDLGEGFIKNVRVHLLMFLRQIENANTESSELDVSMDSDHDVENMPNTPDNRYKLKEKLLKAAKVEKIQSEFEMVRSRFISYLDEMFTKGLQPPHTQPFYEIMFFTEVSNVKKQIIGSPRGAIHTALSNPGYYLQCSCCNLSSSDSVVDTLPDLSLTYKLHRECGKHINLYDWLQAFATVVSPEQDDEERQQDAGIQAKFTRAVAELQFLGFIKSSKRKTDHVMRLTW